MVNSIAHYNPEISLQKNWDENIVPGNHEIEFLSCLTFYGVTNRLDVSNLFWKDPLHRKEALIEKYINHPANMAFIWPYIYSEEQEKTWKHISTIQGEVDFLRNAGANNTADISSIKTVLVRIEGEPLLVEKYQKKLKFIVVIWKVLTLVAQLKLWDERIVPSGQEIQFLSHEGLQTTLLKRGIAEMLSQEEGRRRVALEEKYQNRRKKREFLKAYLHPNAERVKK